METIRRVVRKVVSPDSGVYRAGSTVLDFVCTVRKDGIGTWRTFGEVGRTTARDGSPRAVSLRNLMHPILIRPGSQDASHIIDNIIREEYGQFSPTKEPEYIIDAGAYIGDTATYFLSRFPRAKVISLEPNPESYDMAKRNLEPYGERAVLLRKGLFSDEKPHPFSGSGTGASISSAGFEIECTTIPSLMDRYAIPQIDVLKMDIEGAEEALFASRPESWLRYVTLIIMEIHGSHIESLISRVLSENGFSVKPYRSVWYCLRQTQK